MSQPTHPQPPPPPPPPPPPQPHVPSQPLKPSPLTLSGHQSPQADQNELAFSLHPILSSDTNFNKVYHITNTYLEPQLQDGPKCGLVALSIASSVTESFVPVDEIFQAALSLNVTRQGEMFSADSLAVLAGKFGFRATVLKGGLRAHLLCIVKSLLRKRLLLVPYDADFNHAPCCRQGLKAHWAVISGFVVLEEGRAEDEDGGGPILLRSACPAPCDCPDSSADVRLPLTVAAGRGGVLLERGPAVGAGSGGGPRGGRLYLVGRQGKSRRLGVWGFEDMAESNENLVSVSAGRSAEWYLLPEGGVVEGLRGKCVLLQRPAGTS